MHSSAATAPQPRDRASINRENAQHSTGPKTPEGKANVKLNALRHGACSQQIVLPGEDQQAFEFLGLELLAHWKAANVHERKLVRTLQEYEWRLARLRAAETNLWALGITEQIEKFAQYDEPTRLAFAQAAAFRDNARQFDQISRHENRISKLLKETEAELRHEIAKRREDADDNHVESRIEAFDPMKPEAFDPMKPEPAAAASGFVLQNVLPQNDTPAPAPAPAEAPASKNAKAPRPSKHFKSAA